MNKPVDAAPSLALQALDADDLAVISANLQDSHVAAADLAYLPAQKRFVLVGKRFDWMAVANGGCRRCEVGLHFDRVLGAARTGLTAGNERVLNLLAIDFAPAEAPAGRIILTFSGGAAIRLDVECVEAQLRDLGRTFPCEKAPAHPDAG